MRQKKSLSLQCVLTDQEKLNCSQVQNQAIEQKANAEAWGGEFSGIRRTGLISRRFVKR